MTTESKKRDVALVVDDSPETLRLLTDALDGAGMTVMVAMDGAAAMRIVDQITPDIILLDAVMPGMDGFETCRRLKRDAGLSNVPVIFMTGLAETEHIVRGPRGRRRRLRDQADRDRGDAGADPRSSRQCQADAERARRARRLRPLPARGQAARAGSCGRRRRRRNCCRTILPAGAGDELVLPPPMLQWLEQAQKGKAGAKTPALASFPDNEAAAAAIYGQARPQRIPAAARQGFQRQPARRNSAGNSA